MSGISDLFDLVDLPCGGVTNPVYALHDISRSSLFGVHHFFIPFKGSAHQPKNPHRTKSTATTPPAQPQLLRNGRSGSAAGPVVGRPGDVMLQLHGSSLMRALAEVRGPAEERGSAEFVACINGGLMRFNGRTQLVSCRGID